MSTSELQAALRTLVLESNVQGFECDILFTLLSTPNGLTLQAVREAQEMVGGEKRYTQIMGIISQCIKRLPTEAKV